MEAAKPGKGIQDLKITGTNRRRHCRSISIFIFMAVLLVIFTYQIPQALATLPLLYPHKHIPPSSSIVFFLFK